MEEDDCLDTGAEQFVQKVQNSWVFAPPSSNVDAAAVHIIIVVVVRTRRFLVRIPQRKFSKLFGCFRFREFGGCFKR